MAKNIKTPDPVDVTGFVMIKTKNRKPYRRCGKSFGEMPVELPMTAFTEVELTTIFNDANLIVDVVGATE